MLRLLHRNLGRDIANLLLEILLRATELADALSYLLRYFRDLLWSEQQNHDEHDEQELATTDIKHLSSCRRRLLGACPKNRRPCLTLHP